MKTYQDWHTLNHKPTQDFTLVTLGTFLSSQNETIRRNAISILKELQNNHNTCKYCEQRVKEQMKEI